MVETQIGEHDIAPHHSFTEVQIEKAKNLKTDEQKAGFFGDLLAETVDQNPGLPTLFKENVEIEGGISIENVKRKYDELYGEGIPIAISEQLDMAATRLADLKKQKIGENDLDESVRLSKWIKEWEESGVEPGKISLEHLHQILNGPLPEDTKKLPEG